MKELTADTKIKLSQIKDLADWHQQLVQDKHSPARPGEIRRWSDGKLHEKTKHGWKILSHQENYTLKTDTHKKIQRNINPKHTTAAQFSDVIEKLYNRDYQNTEQKVRFPDINRSLARQLGVDNTTQFLFSAKYSHISPHRKAGEGQVFRKEEYKKIPEVIKKTKNAYIDTEKKNFIIYFADDKDPTMINKLIFNRSPKGNYLVTLGKVNKRDEMASGKKILVKDRS